MKVALHCEMIRVDPDTKEDVYTTCYFSSNLKTIIQKDTVTGEYRVMSTEIRKCSKLSEKGKWLDFSKSIEYGHSPEQI